MAETKTWRRGYLAQLTTRLEEGADEFLKIWKTQAKRPDRVGDATYRGLELVHRGLRVAVRSLSRIERATQLPHRTAKTGARSGSESTRQGSGPPGAHASRQAAGTAGTRADPLLTARQLSCPGGPVRTSWAWR